MELQIGEDARVDGQEKFWSGENYGWQSKEQHDKLKEEGKFKFGAQALDRLQSSAVDAIGGENLVKMAQGFSAVSEPLSKVLKFNPQLSGLYQAQESVGELTSQASGAASDAFNVDKRITDTAAIAAEAFLTGGGPGATKRAAGKLMQAADTLMQPRLNYSLAGISGDMGNVMKAVTTTNPDILGGVRGGIKTGDDLMTPEYGKRLIERTKEIEAKKGSIESLDENIEALTELKSDPKNLEKYISTASDYVQSKWAETGGDVDYIIKRLKAMRKKAQPSLSQSQSNVGPFTKEGDFQKWYDTTAGKAVKTAEEKAQTIKVALEQHHLFPKGISAAYFDKMDQLIAAGKAQADDLIAMFEYAVNKGKTPGDYKINLKNMQKPPHNEMHTILRKQGDELSKGRYQKDLKDVNNVDDLMARWVEMLDDEVSYNIDTANIWEDMGKLIGDIQK